MSDEIVALNRRILVRLKMGKVDPEDRERRDQLMEILQAYDSRAPQ